jgi:DNA-binding winged helix-turn-helix (wHTH) protein/tetratricopeptide (TPR) repeat protein
VSDGGRIRVGESEIDLGSGQLIRGGVVAFIQPKPLALLRELLRQPGRFVTKAELREAVWPDVTVTDAALTSALRDLRRCLGDDGTAPRFVETRRRRGVRLIQPAERVAPAAASSDEASLPCLIGRASLLRAFEGQLDLARAGRGQIAFLCGEPGVGKTSLSLALAARARARGFAVHAGQALEEMDAPPFRPWIQILRELLERREPAALDPALAGAPCEALGGLLGTGPPRHDPAAPGVGERFQLLEAAVLTLRAAARERPRLLILEDLHRADPASLQLLRMLAEEIGDASLFVLGSYRNLKGLPDDAFARALAELPSTVAQIAVPGLDREAVEALMVQTAGQEGSPELAAAIHERTGGNPLFVQEITRALLAEGRFAAPDAATWAARSAPEGVRQVIRRRLDSLTDDVRRVLECAAVAGRSFDRLLLERAWPEAERGDRDDALRAAVEAGLVVEVGGPTPGFAFVHDLFRQALYEGIPADQRAEMHARLGRALVGLGGLASNGWVDAVAHHFTEAASGGSSEEAALWGRKAAERAIDMTAYEDAASHAMRALRAAPLETNGASEPVPTRLRAELFALLGRARWLAGAPAEARQAFRDAIREAEATGAVEVFARAALGFVGPTDATPGVNQEGVALLERALAALTAGDGALRAELLARLATELYYGSDPERSQALAAESVAMAERLGDEGALAYALSAQVYTALRPEIPLEVRLGLADRVVTLTERNDAANTLALGLQERIFAQLELGDGLGVEKSLDAYERVVARLGQPFLRWLLGLFRGMRALLEGRVGDAERLAHETFGRGQALGTPNALGAFAAQLYGIRSEQGRLADLDAPLASLAREQPDLPVFRAASLTVAIACGHRDEARRALGRMLDFDLERLPRDQNWLPVLALLAQASVAVGDEDMVRCVESLCSPYAERIAITGHGAGALGAIGYHLGRLAARLGDLDGARVHFASAHALHERLHAPLWVAHTWAEHAHALRRCGGEPTEVRRLASAAAQAYERFELPHRLERMRALLER